VVAFQLLGAERGHDHQPEPAQPAADEAQHLPCRFVGPVDVLEHQQHRRA
jgi:hypothetical protein